MHNESTEQLVGNFFRHEYASLVAVLTRAFGFALLDVIEDMVQEAMLEALRNWRIKGVPDNPVGWLHRVAKNRIIDCIRREKKSEGELDASTATEASLVISFAPDELQDSLLRMIFICCHPSLDRRSQLALTLKMLCGLNDREIASGLLMQPDAIKKRVTRAKRHLQLNQVPMDFPAESELNQRLDTVHEVLYLMFNEGYSSSSSELPIRIDLCEEAARLCHLLCNSHLSKSTTCGLLALMLYHAARLDARMDEDGQTVLLKDQDRSKWDRKMIAVADQWHQRSIAGQRLSRFHLEAGIVRLHCMAPSTESTNWQAIVKHYDLLQTHFPSPMYTLNRAIALGQLGQWEAAIESIRSIRNEPSMSVYPLLWCSLADLFSQQGDHKAAIENWKRALACTTNPRDRKLINERLDQAAKQAFDPTNLDPG